MTTRLLYLEQPDLFECEVRVLRCEPHPEGSLLFLDQTPFYPEGGGQPSDTGTLGSAAVMQVMIRDDQEVAHLVDQPLAPGQYLATVNVARRLDHAQQHAAQHLLSACLLDLYEAATIGFHMSDLYTSIDLDKKLDQEALNKAVLMANEAVRQAMPIQVLFPSEEGLKALPLRKLPKVVDNIRIIQIGDLDFSPCGGTHPDHTGRIGAIMLTRFENYKAGTRLEFVAGDRAIRDGLNKAALLTSLSQRLAVPVSGLVSSVDKLLAAQSKLEKELQKHREILLDLEAQSLGEALRSSGTALQIKRFQDRDLNALRALATGALKLAPNALLVLGSVSADGNQAQLLCARGEDLAPLDVRELFKPAIEILEGRGGGSPSMAQGGGPRADLLDAALAAAEAAYHAK